MLRYPGMYYNHNHSMRKIPIKYENQICKKSPGNQILSELLQVLKHLASEGSSWQVYILIFSEIIWMIDCKTNRN